MGASLADDADIRLQVEQIELREPERSPSSSLITSFKLHTRMGFASSSSQLFYLFVFGCFVLNIFTDYRANAKLIPPDEVEVLEVISRKIKNLIWNVTTHSCNDNGRGFIINNHYELEVICNCSGNVCHVTEIHSNGHSLVGTLPSEFGNLTHLQILDLSSNYLKGTIPRSFTRLPLVSLYLSSNPINGPIPEEIGEITSLKELGLSNTQVQGTLPSNLGKLKQLQVLDLSQHKLSGMIPESLGNLKNLKEISLYGTSISGKIPDFIGNWTQLQKLDLSDAQLEGTLPSSFGKLKQLKALDVSGNNLSGTIPKSFGNLKNLNGISLSGTYISGKIPDFIGKWEQLEKLDMQGTSMEGPIPTTISYLTNLQYLAISDLHAPSKNVTLSFPILNLTSFLREITLRNCSIHDSIPSYIFKMEQLDYLDLSFNNLTGEIPNNESSFNPQYMYLTGNFLSGKIPTWILQNPSDKNYDLSYNNFSKTTTSGTNCQFGNINLASSLLSSAKASDTCLKRGLPCAGKPKYYSLFINCGGTESVKYQGHQYEKDDYPRGSSYFFLSQDNKWAYSSTGRENDGDNAKVKNKHSLNISGPKFYQTARHSTLSLKYHGLCMMKGSYNVTLYFAEIMFSHYHNSTSLGNRIFDVSIQGTKYLSDFNIMKEAGGPGKIISKEFNVIVNDNTLEIHLYWSGKGTTTVPNFLVHGPLISAISVTPNFKIQRNYARIIELVVGSCVLIIILIIVYIVLRKMGFVGGQNSTDKELLDLKIGYFSFNQIKKATDNFALENKIGEGGFGPVYKGVLSNGVVIAVSSKSKQGNREFINEIGMISALQHPNLVKLYGCCVDGNQLMLIYEYMQNNSLANALFGDRQGQKIHLDWPIRMKICVGIAKGLAYLHEESRLKIVHRDIKATNVLLDQNLNAKMSDFGLARLNEDDKIHISTRIAGTIGYIAPEYTLRDT